MVVNIITLDLDDTLTTSDDEYDIYDGVMSFFHYSAVFARIGLNVLGCGRRRSWKACHTMLM